MYVSIIKGKEAMIWRYREQVRYLVVVVVGVGDRKEKEGNDIIVF